MVYKMVNKMKQKKYVEYEEYLKNKKKVNLMINNNWKYIHEKSTMKIVTGALLFGIGFLTLPIPTGSFILIAVGASLMSSGGLDILALKNTIYWRIKTRLKMWRNE